MWNLHLMRAEQAVLYVETKVRYGAPNRAEDVLHVQDRFFSLNWPIDAPRDAGAMQGRLERSKIQIMELAHGELAESTPRMTALARLTEQDGIGTCIGMSALAFDYLRTHGVPSGLAVFGFQNCDHALVVLGLPSMPPRSEPFSLGGAPPVSWGTEAVVCDPWYHEWFSVQDDWRRKIKQILKRTAPAGALADGQTCKCSVSLTFDALVLAALLVLSSPYGHDPTSQ